ncbi:hypothetical protein FLA_4972 [Filimonas lacunae]|nr:hypothetical protein FLA_4972 [Filimonas lacunae]
MCLLSKEYPQKVLYLPKPDFFTIFSKKKKQQAGGTAGCFFTI